MTDYRDEALQALADSTLTPRQRQEAICLLDAMLRPSSTFVLDCGADGTEIFNIGPTRSFSLYFTPEGKDSGDLGVLIDEANYAYRNFKERHPDGDAREALDCIEDCLRDLKAYLLALVDLEDA